MLNLCVCGDVFSSVSGSILTLWFEASLYSLFSHRKSWSWG